MLLLFVSFLSVELLLFPLFGTNGVDIVGVTVTETKPDGAKMETVTETKLDGVKIETITETKLDGSSTET